jgi:hypothetical protein
MKTLFTILFAGVSLFCQAQEVNGSWYGHAEVMLQGTNNNYLAEMIIKQKGNEVEGVMGYYFKNTYQSFIVRGTYNTKTRVIEIKNIPVMYFRSSASKPTVSCMMDFQAQLLVSKVKTQLRGNFLRDERYRYTCPDLEIVFFKDLNETNTDSLLKEAVAVKKIWSPVFEEVVITPTVVAEKKDAIQEPEVKQFEERKPFLLKEIEVVSDSIRVTLYDNGDIDGDTVSVFYNKVQILKHQGLDAQGVNLYLQLDSTIAVHELSLFAESMGSIPPNTALMIITDGVNRYELFSTSNLSLNGTVNIRRKKPFLEK